MSHHVYFKWLATKYIGYDVRLIYTTISDDYEDIENDNYEIEERSEELTVLVCYELSLKNNKIVRWLLKNQLLTKEFIHHFKPCFDTHQNYHGIIGYSDYHNLEDGEELIELDQFIEVIFNQNHYDILEDTNYFFYNFLYHIDNINTTIDLIFKNILPYDIINIINYDVTLHYINNFGCLYVNDQLSSIFNL